MHRRTLLTSLTLLGLLHSPLHAENWPQWRGPGGMGVSAETDLPVSWSDSENVAWKVDLDVRSHSSVVVWGDRVFLTGSRDGGHRRILFCYDRADGSVLWSREVVYNKDEPTQEQNGYCTATPVTDGERVVALYGSAGVYCYDMQGEPLWGREFGDFFHTWGSSASPMIDGDVVYVYFGPAFEDVLAALDKKTGETLWEKRFVIGGWSGPVLIDTGERRELVLCGSGRVKAFDPATGEPLWFVRGQKSTSINSPLWAHGLLYSLAGGKSDAVAIRPGGKGDVTESHVVWTARGAPHIPSGIVYGDYLYMVTDSAVANCLNAKTGEAVWRDRLGGRFRSSLAAGDGKLYVTNREGDTFVLKAGPEFEVLAVNSLSGDDFQASPAISDGQIFIRADNRLYCIGGAKSGD
jgi:outer membrane protein assembly factor BamB